MADSNGVTVVDGIVKDNIYITDGGEHRVVCVSPYLPPNMQRSHWGVDNFELHKELYRGKTSLLYMATDRQSGVPVALKLYRKKKLSVLNRYQVEREIRIHIGLNHENIIKLFAAFEDEKNVYMVQEYAGAGDLFEDLKRQGGQIREKQAVRDVLYPFITALVYLHNLGIIHRDIKPENILLTSNKVVKIADFGLSIDIKYERPVTRAGTLDYMAPEVLICPDKRRPEENKDKAVLAYTAQVDAWAVGILAYELLVGYPPFEQESRAATYEHIMYKEPKFPAWMTEEAKRFISTALIKNASQRCTVYDLIKQPWIVQYIGKAAVSSGGAPEGGSSRLKNTIYAPPSPKPIPAAGPNSMDDSFAGPSSSGSSMTAMQQQHLASSREGKLQVSIPGTNISGSQQSPKSSVAASTSPSPKLSGFVPSGSAPSPKANTAPLLYQSNVTRNSLLSADPHGNGVSMDAPGSAGSGRINYDSVSISDPAMRSAEFRERSASQLMYHSSAGTPSSMTAALRSGSAKAPLPPLALDGEPLSISSGDLDTSTVPRNSAGQPLMSPPSANSSMRSGVGMDMGFAEYGGGLEPQPPSSQRNSVLTRPPSIKSRLAPVATPSSPYGNKPDPTFSSPTPPGYTRPQSGVLSDDSITVLGRTPSYTPTQMYSGRPANLALSNAALQSPSASRRNSANIQIDRYQGPSSQQQEAEYFGYGGSDDKHSHPEPIKSPGSKYTKVFAKLWGGKEVQHEVGSPGSGASFSVQPSGGSMSGRSPQSSVSQASSMRMASNSNRSKSVGKAHLHEDLARSLSRESSLLLTPRQESLTQMRPPEVRMRHLAQMQQQMQQMQMGSDNMGGGSTSMNGLGGSGGGAVGGGRVSHLLNKNLLQASAEELSPAGRINSESVLVRPHFRDGNTRNSSFTASAQAQKLAAGAVATKVAEYAIKARHMPDM